MAERRGRLSKYLQTAWFLTDLAVLLWPLLPLSWLFGILTAMRRLAYRRGWLQTDRLPVPVVVVGNLTVGGAGKTPLTLHIVEALRASGRSPGIVSRGYGGEGRIREVAGDSDGLDVGDEPVLLRQRAGVPVFVGRRRSAAGQALLTRYPAVDVIVCDDGLQHYALARDFEIVVVDGRGFGNGHLMPVGPLREPVSRLDSVDAIVFHGGEGVRLGDTIAMQLEPGEFRALQNPASRCAPSELSQKRLHAIAGIGHPERFFDTLRSLGLSFEAHAFPDHHRYSPTDLAFGEAAVVLMTEKDAVKCRPFYHGEAWVLPVSAVVEPRLTARILEKIDGRQAA